MIFDQETTIPVPVGRVWDFLMDVSAVSRCVPGVDGFAATDADHYTGALKVRLGPIGVRLEGRITVAERDRDALRTRLDIQAADRRINSNVNAQATITLTELGADSTRMSIHTEASVLGKLGEFGQGIMRRKADQIVGEFGSNVARTLTAAG